jgi:hypothetical protein
MHQSFTLNFDLQLWSTFIYNISLVANGLQSEDKLEARPRQRQALIVWRHAVKTSVEYANTHTQQLCKLNYWELTIFFVVALRHVRHKTETADTFHHQLHGIAVAQLPTMCWNSFALAA